VNPFGAAGIFCLAASKGNIQMLRLLHENGIDRNAVDYDDRSALHLACADKQILSVNHLLYVCQVRLVPTRT
jgi:ankyrin repeat protein